MRTRAKPRNYPAGSPLMAAFYHSGRRLNHDSNRPPARHHETPARPGKRLPVGQRADLRHHRALYPRRDLRSAGRHFPREDFDDLRGELGDLLFQVVFYAQMAQEEGRFNFDDICAAISDKLERRHPHIFGDATAGNTRPKCWPAGSR